MEGETGMKRITSMKPTLSTLYDANFYSAYIKGMTNSAINVLSLLYKYYKPKSVIDVGCGRGAWLAAAESLGSNKLRGFDGSWIKKEDLLSNNIEFTAINFDNTMPEITERYDLCISLEVAEHINEKNAKLFIDILCMASDIVLFSAAIKGQGGTNHINEQPQSYWIDIFNSNGYECFDILRASLWINESVEYWYRQNMFILARQQNGLINGEMLRAAEKPTYDIVHPKYYELRVNEIELKVKAIRSPTLRFCLGCIKRFIVLNIRRLIGNTTTP